MSIESRLAKVEQMIAKWPARIGPVNLGGLNLEVVKFSEMFSSQSVATEFAAVNSELDETETMRLVDPDLCRGVFFEDDLAIIAKVIGRYIPLTSGSMSEKATVSTAADVVTLQGKATLDDRDDEEVDFTDFLADAGDSPIDVDSKLILVWTNNEAWTVAGAACEANPA